MAQRRLYLVAYDIASPRARARALAAARAFGLGGQKSAHECSLTATERRELAARLAALIDRATDRLLVMRLDPRSPTRGLGAARPAGRQAWTYIG